MRGMKIIDPMWQVESQDILDIFFLRALGTLTIK